MRSVRISAYMILFGICGSAFGDVTFHIQPQDWKFRDTGSSSYSTYSVELETQQHFVQVNFALQGPNVPTFNQNSIDFVLGLNSDGGYQFDIDNSIPFGLTVKYNVSFIAGTPTYAYCGYGGGYTIVPGLNVLTDRRTIFCYNSGLSTNPLPISLTDVAITFVGDSPVVQPSPTPPPAPSPTPWPTPVPAVALSGLVITQALDNFTIDPQAETVDLVAGKDTAIQLNVKLGSLPTNSAQEIVIKATLDDGTSTSKAIDPSSALSGILVTLPSFIPKSAGPTNLTVSAASDGGISGSLPPQKLNVHQTNSISLGFVPIDGCTGGTKCFDAFDRAGMSSGLDVLSQFTVDTYPVATSGGLTSIMSSSALGTPHTDPLGVVEDLMTLALISKRTNVDRVVGLVSQSYLIYHHEDFGGVANPNLPGAVIISSLTPVNGLAHELGHTFGLLDQYDSNHNYTGVSVTDGFNVRASVPVGTAQNFMGPAPRGPVWVSDETFGALINALSKPIVDPGILIVSGLVNSNGTVSVRQMYNSPSGTLTESVPGIFSINAVDSDGQLISSTTLNPNFYTYIDPPEDGGDTNQRYGAVPVAAAPFVVAIENRAEIASLQFVSNGKVVTTVDPRGNSLIDAINAIPDNSYVRKPEIVRMLLLTQAKIIQRLLGACEKLRGDKRKDNFEKTVCTDNIENLVLVLRREIAKNLNDSTAKTDPLQMTRDEVLRSVDFTALNLLGNPRVQSAGRTFKIRILPALGKGVLKVESVTQGTSGTVTMNANGTLTYKASKAVQTDSFSVVVSTVDGDKSTKTVSIVSPCADSSEIERWEKRFK